MKLIAIFFSFFLFQGAQAQPFEQIESRHKLEILVESVSSGSFQGASAFEDDVNQFYVVADFQPWCPYERGVYTQYHFDHQIRSSILPVPYAQSRNVNYKFEISGDTLISMFGYIPDDKYKIFSLAIFEKNNVESDTLVGQFTVKLYDVNDVTDEDHTRWWADKGWIAIPQDWNPLEMTDRKTGVKATFKIRYLKQ